MNQPVYILSVLNLAERHLTQLKSVSPRLIVQQHSLSPHQVLSDVLSADVEILYTHTASFDLHLTPNLRWVQVDSAGVNLLHNTPLWKSDIAITSANGVHSVQIAEYVLATLLAHIHHLATAYRLQERKQWANAQQLAMFTTSELRGKTLGILGYGAIGREVARLGASFGMNILATQRRGQAVAFNGWSPVGIGDPAGSIPQQFYDLDELHTMLAACDVVVLALPLNQQTQHIIDRRALAAMRPQAMLINIGRGGLVDQDELVTALREHRLAGAVLDVTDPEPLPSDHPLWAMENVTITPHVAGLSTYYDDRITELFSENLRRYLNGEPLLNLVERELGY